MEPRTITVNMAEMAVIRPSPGESVALKTTLGSCVGVILADRGRGIFALAHVMLPENTCGDEVLGKYVDTAVPSMLQQMQDLGSGGAACVQAIVTGGARLFDDGGCAHLGDIGRRNVEAARAAMAKLHIPIIREETGGTAGRTVIYDCATSQISIKTLRKLGGPV